MKGHLSSIVSLAAAAIVCFPMDAFAGRSFESQVTSHGGKRFGSVTYTDKVRDKGDARVSYVRPHNNPAMAKLSEQLEKEGQFTEFVKSLNDAIALPDELKIEFNACGQVNAFYNPGDKKITMCLELMAYYRDLFEDDEDLDDDEKAVKVRYAGASTLMHELGHALIDMYDIPVLGREEDAADGLAAILGLAMDDDAEIVEASLREYEDSFESEEEIDDSRFADEHALDQVRWFNTVCWVYGSNPDKFADWVDEDYLPEARAVRCPDEYQKLERSWSKVLEPYLKS